MARATLRTKIFLAALSASLIALVVAAAIFEQSMRRRADEQIEATLVADAKLTAELLARTESLTAVSELDKEADRIGALLGARVTFIAPDGRVVGDSAETLEGIAAMDNQASRPEVVAARQAGLGRARRQSDASQTDTLHVAAAVTHPAIAFVRVALPVSDSRQQLQTILNAVLFGLGLGLMGAAGAAWLISSRIGRRVRGITEIAQHYRRGDLTPPRIDYGDDELGSVAQALDAAVRELGRRLAELSQDRARMEA